MTRTGRRRLLPVGIAALVLTTAACSTGGSGAASTSASPAPRTSTARASSPSPSTTAPKPATDPLTGGRMSTNPVIAVKLENTQAAMPQIGLSPADLVFVEEVEGGLTRLMPIYHSSFPRRVEPVRSARSTDIGILPVFGRPTLVYSGVASQIRGKLTRAPIRLDSAGTRDPSRPAPHNLFFDIAAIARHLPHHKPANIGLSFAKTDAGLRTAPKQADVTVRIGGDRFSFSYHGSVYLPSWNGRPYTDAGAHGKRVTAANVLVLRVREVSDGYRDPAGNPVSRSVSTGSGGLTLYRNGRKLTGTWHRSAADRPFRLRGSHGTTLRLAPGRTWILLQP